MHRIAADTAAPVFRLKTVSVTGTYAEPVTLNVTADGQAPLWYQWFRGTVPLGMSGQRRDHCLDCVCDCVVFKLSQS